MTIRRFGPHIEENPERAVEWLLRISSYGILESSIDHQTLMRAPRRFRKALLLDPSCRFLFEKELKRSLQESPEEIDGSPAAIRLNELRESVLRSLTHDSYSDEEISEWLDHPKIMLRSSKSIIASLKKQTRRSGGNPTEWACQLTHAAFAKDAPAKLRRSIQSSQQTPLQTTSGVVRCLKKLNVYLTLRGRSCSAPARVP